MTVKTHLRIEQHLDNLDKGCMDEGELMALKDLVRDDDLNTECTTLGPVASDDEKQRQAEPDVLPTLPESVYAGLPEFLKKVVSVAETREERDMLLLGSTVVLGAGMPKLFGIYDDMEVRPNLYLYVTAKADAGKDLLNWSRHLVMPIHLHLRRQYAIRMKEYANQLRFYHSNKQKDPSLEIPQKPHEQKFFIPGKSTATGMYQLLSDNNGQGLIFETEGDILSLAFKSRRGHYLDCFHKAFHHESISCYRWRGHKLVAIDSPGISTVLAGTNKQMATLIPSAENELLSRFMFYNMNSKPVWTNVFAQAGGLSLNEHFDQLGAEFFKLYEALNANVPIQFSFTQQQQDEFHLFFSQLQDNYLTLQGMGYIAVIRRLGLIAFRMAMIFNGLRMLETGDFSQKQECRDVDFYATLAMIKVLIRHSGHVFTQLQ